MNKDRMISGLNNLLEKSYDAEKGFLAARNSTNSTWLMSYFDKKIKERKNCQTELQSLISDLGGSYIDSGSMAGAIHRNWLDFKSDIASSTDEAVVEEVITGEKAALSDYQSFVKEHDNMPSNVKTIVDKHMDQLTRSINKAELIEAVC